MLVDKDDTLFHGVVNPKGLLHNSESSPPFGQNSLTGPLQNCFLALMESDGCQCPIPVYQKGWIGG